MAAGGEEGVFKAIDILKDELERAMGLLGVGTVEELKRRGPDLVRRRGPSVRDYAEGGGVGRGAGRGFGGGII